MEDDIVDATEVDFSLAAFAQFDKELVSLLGAMMSIDSAKRPTAAEVLQHPYMKRRRSLSKKPLVGVQASMEEVNLLDTKLALWFGSGVEAAC